MKLLEWNIHKMTNDIKVQQFVIETILNVDADIIVLTEYLTDSGIENCLKDNYWLEESNIISGNKVFIAVKKVIAIKGISVKNKEEEVGCYNFLHIDFEMKNGNIMSLIGVRMLSPIDASKQTSPLNRYISKIKNPFLCTGDFNIRRFRINKWLPNIAMSKIVASEDELTNSSIIYVDKNTKQITGFGIVDHVLHSKNLAVNSEYNWDFVSKDSVYPNIENITIDNIWDIPASYPDHALMISDIEILE